MTGQQEGQWCPWGRSSHSSLSGASGVLCCCSCALLWSQFHFQIGREAELPPPPSSWQGPPTGVRVGTNVSYQSGCTNSFPGCLHGGIGQMDWQLVWVWGSPHLPKPLLPTLAANVWKSTLWVAFLYSKTFLLGKRLNAQPHLIQRFHLYDFILRLWVQGWWIQHHL